MLNFLTQNIKEKVINEYTLRLIIVFLIIIFIACVFLISLFLPSLFISQYKEKAIENQYETVMSNLKKSPNNPIEIVKEKNSLISALSSEMVQDLDTPTSKFIEDIISLKNKNIQIKSFSIYNKAEEIKIIISGTSKTRDSLTLFNKTLKDSHYFDEVILPVVNFIKGIDVDFSITLVHKQK